MAIPTDRIVSLEGKTLARKTPKPRLGRRTRITMPMKRKPTPTPCTHTKRGFRTDIPIPSLLLACHESHAVALRFYSRTFGSRDGLDPLIYFSFRTDTLLLDRCPIVDRFLMLNGFIPEDLARIEKLALCSSRWTLPDVLDCTLSLFPSLKTLTIVVSTQNLPSSPTTPLASHANLTFLSDLTYRKYEYLEHEHGGRYCISGYPAVQIDDPVHGPVLAPEYLGLFGNANTPQPPRFRDWSALKLQLRDQSVVPNLRELCYRILTTVEVEELLLEEGTPTCQWESLSPYKVEPMSFKIPQS